MTPFQVAKAALLVGALTVLAACESTEERIARHLESARTLMAEGDLARAKVELRNIIQLDGAHVEARRLQARIFEEEGRMQAAAASWLRVAEETPEDVEAHAAIARIAIGVGDQEAAGRHSARALALAPDVALHRALGAAVAFAAAPPRSPARREASQTAEAALVDDPDLLIARTVVIANTLEEGRLEDGLALTEEGLSRHPDALDLHLMKLTLLRSLDRLDEVTAHLTAMVARFPDRRDISDMLLSWHAEQGNIDAAEAMLRARADAVAVEDSTDDMVALIRFLNQYQGPDAAAADLATRRAAADSAGARIAYGRLEAALAVERGQQAEATAILTALATEDPGENDRARDAQHAAMVDLARLERQAGRVDEANRLVAQVLEEDPEMVGALALRARALIDADDPGAAIADLRLALRGQPNDPRLLTLMAEAHTRDGAHALAGERLALAVEAANGARGEALRYADYLIRDDRAGPAESVLASALRQTPEDLNLTAALGRVRVLQGDLSGAADIVARLRAGGAGPAAEELQTRILAARRDIDGLVATLTARLEASEGRDRVQILASLVSTHLDAGDSTAAAAAIAAERGTAEGPEPPALRLLEAGIAMQDARYTDAEDLYRSLIAEAPAWGEPWLGLTRALAAQGEAEASRTALREGIAASNDPRLRLIEAGHLERRDGDIEGAIAIYEGLYAENSGNTLVANNLASLIASHDPSAEGLERALRIARRLNGTDVPEFQDTYGWLLARSGETEEALDYLRPAAAARSEDPLILIHLGLTEADAGNRDAAETALETALALAADGAPGLEDKLAEAQAALETLKTAPGE